MRQPFVPSPVDRVEILSVVDNVCDLLLMDTEVAGVSVR